MIVAGERRDEDQRQCRQAGEQVQRIEPDQPRHGEVGECHPRREAVGIGVGEDEAAEDEEQVDREVACRRPGGDRVVRDVAEGDGDRRDAAQPVERAEGAARGRHCGGSWRSDRPSSHRRWKPGQ